MVLIQSAFTLPVPAGEAFDLLVDPDTVAASLPGARPSSPGAAEGELDLDVGFAMVTVRGGFERSGHDREQGSIDFRAVGAEVESGAELRAGGAFRLNDAGGVTEVGLELEVEAGGLLAAGGPSGVERTLRRLVDAFALGLRERLPARAAGASEDVDARAELEAGELEAEEELEAVGYGWMVAAGDDTEGLPPVPGEPESTPAPPPAGEPPPLRRPQREVPGRVRVVTSGPLAAAGIPVGDSARARIHALHRSRPWLIPAVLVGLLALALLLRRRSDRD